MSALIGDKRRPLDPATFDSMGTPRVKVASRRGRKWTWNIALQQLPLSSRMGLRERDRRKQGTGIGVPWSREQFVRSRGLDDAAEVHDRNPIRDVFDHRKIVRNENVSEGKALAKVGEQVEHLRTNRDIERRNRLVTNNKLRFNCESARDRDALPLSAGKFVRVSLSISRVEPDETEKLGDTIAPARCENDIVQCERLGDQLSHGHSRIER